MQLRSGMAVAEAGKGCSDSTPSPGTSPMLQVWPGKKKKKPHVASGYHLDHFELTSKALFCKSQAILFPRGQLVISRFYLWLETEYMLNILQGARHNRE